jgi:hypothetical protein
MKTKLWLSSSILLASVFASSSVQAIELRSGFGGPAGFGDLSQLRNDDGSSSRLNLPFTLNFFGSSYSTFWVNNNGNITFGGPVGSYTPNAFPVSGQPMIAPFWGDVDTRGTGAVYTASPDANTLVATWHNVGYYGAHTDKVNDFQLTLLNRPDTGAGNFDIEFRYRQLEWTTGDASGGSGGLGGTPAQAGYDAGDNTHFFALPGSLTSSVLNLANTSNVSEDTPGLWTMAIRNGETSDGSSPDAPLLPVIVQDGAWHFDFNIDLNERIFIDPLVAIGYDYEVTSGPNIQTALFPVIAGDTDGYEVFGFNTGTNLYDVSLGHVNAGDVFDFGPSGVSRFGLRDIDITAGLDPANTQAFVTGLTFVSAGAVSMTQTPVSVDVSTNNVPEPSTIALLLAGLLGCGVLRRRQSY